jgi:chromosome segregation ATPase
LHAELASKAAAHDALAAEKAALEAAKEAVGSELAAATAAQAELQAALDAQAAAQVESDSAELAQYQSEAMVMQAEIDSLQQALAAAHISVKKAEKLAKKEGVKATALKTMLEEQSSAVEHKEHASEAALQAATAADAEKGAELASYRDALGAARVKVTFSQRIHLSCAPHAATAAAVTATRSHGRVAPVPTPDSPQCAEIVRASI